MRRVLFLLPLAACLPNPPSPPAAAPLTRDADTASSPPAKARPVALTLARGVSCARMSDAAVYCWGNNDSGQIGTGSRTRVVPKPTRVPGVEALQVVAGPGQVCALGRDRSVACWGENVLGLERQNANRHPGRLTPTPIPGLDGAVEIALGFDHACARLADGSVRCWGENRYGELGIGHTTPLERTPLPVLGLPKVTHLALGHARSWAVTAGGDVWSWGGGEPTPARRTDLGSVTQLTAGSGEVCALDASLGVRCWEGDDAPMPFSALQHAASVHLAEGHGCALQKGQVSCWGWNHRGQTGRPPMGEYDGLESREVAAISGLPEVTTLATGGSHSCAITRDHAVYCWGSDSDGQLGIGTELFSDVPAEVVGIAGVAEVAARSARTCALLDSGALRCWGKNEHGELGVGDHLERPMPSAPLGIGRVNAFAMGFDHTCVSFDGDRIRCWGDDHHGYVGELPDAPQEVVLPSVTAIAAGQGETCAIAGGTLHCWGATRPKASQVVPTPVALPARPVAVTLGHRHGCALVDGGDVHCWGENHRGQLGDGTTQDSEAPAKVRGLGVSRSIVSGGAHVCAVSARDELRCWGYNDNAQIGDGISNDRLSPSRVLDGVEQVALSTSHSCALMKSGLVMCWGANSDAQLGRGTRSGSEPRPAVVKGLPKAVALAAGDGHTCAKLAGGHVRCWGTDYLGQLGRGRAGYRHAPVRVHF